MFAELPIAYTEIPVTPDTISTMDGRGHRTVCADPGRYPGLGSATRLPSAVKTRPACFITELQNLAGQLEPYAIVLGPMAPGNLERFLLGSNTIQPSKPALAPAGRSTGGRFQAIRKVGLACDLRKVVETAPVEELKTLVRNFQAELHVIHVNSEDEKSYSSEIIEESGCCRRCWKTCIRATNFSTTWILTKA